MSIRHSDWRLTWRALPYPSRSGAARSEAEGGRPRLPLEPRHRRRLDGARVLARRDARLHRRGRRHRHARAGRAARLVRPDPVGRARPTAT